VFVVVPLHRLPAAETAWAKTFARSAGRVAPLAPSTPVLALAGTAGTAPAWSDRTKSNGHRAIPLIDRSFVAGAPMIGALLSSLKLDLGVRNDGEIELRAVQGGVNARFFVDDATTAVDAEGRSVIGARDFVEAHHVRSVWGMGGSYVGGELAIAIVFTCELLRAHDVDRFTSLISTFKMATSTLVTTNRVFA
jgi:hypothetical protein